MLSASEPQFSEISETQGEVSVNTACISAPDDIVALSFHPEDRQDLMLTKVKGLLWEASLIHGETRKTGFVGVH